MLNEGYLTGQLLIAMPTLGDDRFDHSVIFICSHNEDGAMGLVINETTDELTFIELLEQLEIISGQEEIMYEGLSDEVPIYAGGPVEQGRGFILHSSDYKLASTLEINKDISLTATAEILSAIVNNEGPEKYLIALGYAGWSSGQLEAEINQNSWLTVEADPDLLFGCDIQLKWNNALAKLGINSSLLSAQAGQA